MKMEKMLGVMEMIKRKKVLGKKVERVEKVKKLK